MSYPLKTKNIQVESASHKPDATAIPTVRQLKSELHHQSLVDCTTSPRPSWAGDQDDNPDTPPATPEREPMITMTAKQFAEAVKASLNDLSSGLSEKSEQAADPVEEKAEDSKSSYITVKELWDKLLYAYKITKTAHVEPVDEYNEYLFVVRIRTDRTTLRSIKYIDVKSPHIREMLMHVLRGVRNVSLSEDKPSVEERLLFSFLPQIKEYTKSRHEKPSTSDQGCSDLDVLVKYLDSEYQSFESRVQSLLKNKEITYDLLWTIFKPNESILIFCPGTGVPACVRCNHAEERTRSDGSKYFHVEARYLTYNGEIFGEATKVLSIEHFRGAKRIDLLPSYPLAYHPRPQEMEQQLLHTGKRFLSLLGVHHRTYQGKAFYYDQHGKVVTVTVDKSRIMVDPMLFRKRNPNYRKVSAEKVSDLHLFDLSKIFNDEEEEVTSLVEDRIQGTGQIPQTLPEHELLICNSTVFGFSLKLKSWLEFAVAHVSDIAWDEASFDNLAISENRKRAIRALCQAHLARDSTHAFEDFVAGKGRGLIVLLHGPPGVGKTLTAETVSEHLHRPFYPISAGDLGVNSATLEHNLNEVFELSSSWKATLLLDEADVFVEKRSNNDIHRNALVCIFLRKLEYYDGVIFMTTNRVQTIDDAFASRIHMPLRYGELDKDARKKIWQGQLRKATTESGSGVFSSAAIDKLASRKLNGREITNATSTAQAMALLDGTVVNMQYLQDALELGTEFQRDFKGAGYFDNQRAYT